MAETTSATGKCLCGAVKVSAKAASPNVGACHCSMCRTWGGGPLMAIDCGTDVSIDGEDNISVFDSSAWAERGFCKKCGSHLFYRLKPTGQYIMPAGLFPDGDLNFDHQVYIDEKPAYYDFGNKTENLTGAQVIEMFGMSN